MWEKQICRTKCHLAAALRTVTYCRYLNNGKEVGGGVFSSHALLSIQCIIIEYTAISVQRWLSEWTTHWRKLKEVKELSTTAAFPTKSKQFPSVFNLSCWAFPDSPLMLWVFVRRKEGYHGQRGTCPSVKNLISEPRDLQLHTELFSTNTCLAPQLCREETK